MASYSFLANTGRAPEDTPLPLAWVALVVVVLTLPVFLTRFSRRVIVGRIVRASQETTGKGHRQVPVWSFEVQRFARNGEPCRDRRGLLVPRVRVTCPISKTHGAEPDEGNELAVRGHRRHDVFVGREGWNLTPDTGARQGMRRERLVGRVVDRQPVEHLLDTRYQDGRQLQILSFKIQPTDDSWDAALRDAGGDLLTAVPVVIRAREVGMVVDGDRVELTGRVLDGAFYPDEVVVNGAPLSIRGRSDVL